MEDDLVLKCDTLKPIWYSLPNWETLWMGYHPAFGNTTNITTLGSHTYLIEPVEKVIQDLVN